jgi:His-Xaa-Ser system protein HxsD
MNEGIVRTAAGAMPVRPRQDGCVALEVDREVYSKDAILRAAYKFTDRCYLFIQTHYSRDDRWVVVIRPKSDEISADDLAGDFANELIDQGLRERLEQQFGDVRTLIVAQAFSEGNLLDKDRAEGDYQSDPRGIGRLRP